MANFFYNDWWKKNYIPDCSALWFLAEAILFNYLRFVSSRSLRILWDTVARFLSFPLKKTFVCPLEDLSLLCLPGTGFQPSFVQWGDGLYSKIFFLLLLSGRIAEQDRRSPFWNLRIQCSRFLLFIEIYRNHLFFWILSNRTTEQDGRFPFWNWEIYFPGHFHDF